MKIKNNPKYFLLKLCQHVTDAEYIMTDEIQIDTLLSIA